jgi:hypothetical protein
VLTAGLDVAILIGERPPFEVLFLFSNVGRVAAGALGGYLAASSSRTTG